jgi:ABC-type phosphate transport system auxiliary subunit
MTNVIQKRIERVLLQQKKKKLKRELKNIACRFVQNDQVIKKAINLKKEQKQLINDFNNLKKQINEINCAEDDDYDEPYLWRYLCCGENF